MNEYEELQAIMDLIEQQQRRLNMIGEKLVEGLRKEAEGNHIGFCFGTYSEDICWDCGTEHECLRLFLKEKERNDK
jgi:hypothetical protein